ncbi:MAG: hypothetical protein QM784_23070 [Polyangiaceae bacterium]
MEKPKYHRLPGRHVGWFARDSLWCAEDHLLWIRNVGFLERYHRYYFKDIQALRIVPSRRARNLTIALGVPVAFAMFVALLAVAKRVHVGWAIGFASIAAPCFIALILNLVRGPTCVTRIYTAVSDVVLPSLGRRPAALRAAALIAGFVHEVQGAADASQLGYGTVDASSLGLGRKHLDTARRSKPIDEGPSVEQARAASLGLLVQGASELLVAISAAVVMGFPAFRQGATLFFLSLVLVLIVSSVLLSRLAKKQRWPAVLSMAHGLVVGIASYGAAYVSAFRAIANGPNPQLMGFEAFDPSSGYVLAVLWFGLGGALALAATNFLSFLRRGAQS